MHNIIAISGKLRHGKNTLADDVNKLIREHELDYYRLAFADPVKEIATIMFPQIPTLWLYGSSEFRDNVVEGTVNQKTGRAFTVRDILLKIGAMGRECNKDVWIMATADKIEKTINSYCDGVIITDCRYRNEMAYLKKEQIPIIRVIREGLDITSDDPSEIDLDGVDLKEFDMVIVNKELDDLKNAAKQIVERYILGKGR